MDTIEKLRPLLHTNFQRELLDAAEMSAQAEKNPLRLNNFSAAFRELVRDVLDNLAPEDEIKKCSWFVADDNSKTGITRAQRVSFVIHGGISPAYAIKNLQIDVPEEKKQLIATIKILSKFTHVNIETFNSPADEVELYVFEASEALRRLLLAAADARKVLIAAIEEQVEEEVVRAVISETVLSVDELASHHSVDGVDVHKIEVTRIGVDDIEFLAHGTIEVELQWGSNSDVRNDNGALMSESFPLSMKLTSPVDDPTAVAGIEDTLIVDTSDWYGNRRDDDDD